MNITKRSVTNAHEACFAPTGDRVYTRGSYFCGYALPSLQRLFRTRGRIVPRCISIKPHADKLILAYADGIVEMRDGITGQTRETLDLNTAILHFDISPCGRFAIAGTLSDELAVFELQSCKEVWKQAKQVSDVAWLQPGPGFVVATRDSKAETWTWPAAQQPRSTIQLSSSLNRLVLLGTRIVTDSYPAISVKDLNDGTELFCVPYKSISTPSWLRDGKLFVARTDTCELYGADGALLHKIATPTLWYRRHAFSPVRDDAVLLLQEGILFIEGFQSFMDSHLELPKLFEPPPARREVTSIDVCTYPAEPDQQIAVEATSPEELMQALQAFERPAWLPTLVEERSEATSSKFGGIPWLGTDEQWPRCGQCAGYMNLFLQLNSAELPGEAREYFAGLLQVFVCENDSSDGGLCLSHEAFSNAALVRICHPNGAPACSELPDPELYDEQHIVAWTRKSDLPGGQELKKMGVTLCQAQYDMELDKRFNFPLEGDKLLGWPAWQQNVERHECPICHEAMRPIFQIDSCRGVPAMLGDGGRGWIVQCPTHRDTVAFHWTF
jgi:uncharacterized protein YwqG